MATQVYTNARPRKIPFFTLDHFSYILSRSTGIPVTKYHAVLQKPSIHDALWEQGSVVLNARVVVKSALEGVG